MATINTSAADFKMRYSQDIVIVVHQTNKIYGTKRGPDTCRIAQGRQRLVPNYWLLFFNKVWQEEKVPEPWTKRKIVKMSKYGDLNKCDNWRVIDILSVKEHNILQNTTVQNKRKCAQHIKRLAGGSF